MECVRTNGADSVIPYSNKMQVIIFVFKECEWGQDKRLNASFPALTISTCISLETSSGESLVMVIFP